MVFYTRSGQIWLMEEAVGLTTLFKGSVARVVDALLTYEGWDYSKADIARNAGVTYKTLFDAWPALEKHALVKQTRTVGRAKMYALNTANPIVKELKKIQRQILFEYLDKHAEKVKEAALIKAKTVL